MAEVAEVGPAPAAATEPVAVAPAPAPAEAGPSLPVAPAAASAAATATAAADDASASEEAGTAVVVSDANDLRPWSISLLLPGRKEPVRIQLSPVEMVQDVRSWVLEMQETCHHTCFFVEFTGRRLSDFIELRAVKGLASGASLRIVTDTYTLSAVTSHLRRLHDILKTGLAPPLRPLHQPSVSLALLSSVGSVPQESYDPADLASLFKLPSMHGEVVCIDELAFSGYHPPRPNRRLQGDVAYLVAKTLEGTTFHISACANGFFVNQSTAERFDPREHLTRGPLSATLKDLLEQISPCFKARFQDLQTLNGTRLPAENAACSFPVNSWVQMGTPHGHDAARAQDSSLLWCEDVPFVQQARDWNEEYASIRDMAKETTSQRHLRDRSLHKFLSDYATAATRGALAIVEGDVLPLNPLEAKDAHMFVWNNMFFSFALDGRGHFKNSGGDHAAHVSCGRDVSGVQAFERLDQDKLYTLGTVVVDYKGFRVVAQSIIPGILRPEQSSTVVYGSIDVGESVSADDTFNDMLAKTVAPLHIKPHLVADAKGDTFLVHSSAETKGILGADGRHYVLDIYRLTPPDVLFLPGDLHDEHTKKMRDTHFPPSKAEGADAGAEPADPDAVRHSLFVYRYELVQAYHDALRMSAIRDELLRVGAPQKDGTEEGSEDQGVKSAAPEVSEAQGDVATAGAPSPDVPTAPVPAATASDDAEAERIVVTRNGQETALFLPRSQVTLRLNPDVYTRNILGGSKEEQEQDQADVRALGQFLMATVIPKLVDDLVRSRFFPVDGDALTSTMHARGINMRYLGHIATQLQATKVQQPLVDLFVVEMICRAAKYLFRNFLRQVPNQFTALATAHFLNCFLGRSKETPWSSWTSAKVPKAGKKKGKPTLVKQANKHGSLPVCICELTREKLWEDIAAATKLHFRFTLGVRTCVGLGVSRLAICRNFCKKTGVQLLARRYNFAVLTRPTFEPADVQDLQPVLKHTSKLSDEGHTLLAASSNCSQQGNIPAAIEYLESALNLFQQTHGHLHATVAHCFQNLAQILVSLGRTEATRAIELQTQAAVTLERVAGFDHSDTVRAIIKLAHYCNRGGRASKGVALMQHARRLLAMSFSEQHPELLQIDNNIAVMYLSLNKAAETLAQLQPYITKFASSLVGATLSVGTAFQLGAKAMVLKGASFAKQAVALQRTALLIFKELLKPASATLKESEQLLSKYTTAAVRFQSQGKVAGNGNGTSNGGSTSRNGSTKKVAVVPTVTTTKVPQQGLKAATNGSDDRSIAELLMFIDGGSDKPSSNKPGSGSKKKRRKGGKKGPALNKQAGTAPATVLAR